MTRPAIGFIGLGLMGSAMVERLLDKGYAVTVMANRSRANVDAAVARGAAEVGSARELAAASEVVMLCVGTSPPGLRAEAPESNSPSASVRPHFVT